MLPIVRVLAPNPSVYTLEGTNTWIVGDDPVVVIDPGPDDPGHLDEVALAAGAAVSAVLVTHDHPDHAPGAASFAARVDAPLYAFRLAGAEHLRDGQQLQAGALTLTAVHTPGHTSDHMAFHVSVRRRPVHGRRGARPRHELHRSARRRPRAVPAVAHPHAGARPPHDLPRPRAGRARSRRQAAGVRRPPRRARAAGDRGDLARDLARSPRSWARSTPRTRRRCTSSRLGRCWRTC